MCFSQICCTEKIRQLLPREMGKANSVVNPARLPQRWTQPLAALIRESQEVRAVYLRATMRTMLQPQVQGGEGETTKPGKACDSYMAFFSYPPLRICFCNWDCNTEGQALIYACSPQDRAWKWAGGTGQEFRTGRKTIELSIRTVFRKRNEFEWWICTLSV